MYFALARGMKNGKFDDLMSQLSEAAELERAAEIAQRARLAKRKRIFSYIGMGVVVLIGCAAGYYRAEIIARLPHGIGLGETGTSAKSTDAAANLAILNGTNTVAGAPPMTREAKLKQTVLVARENAALIDNIMDNVPDADVGKVPVSTNAADMAGTNGRGSLKTAMQNAKTHAALVDSIMDGKSPPTNAIAPRPQ